MLVRCTVCILVLSQRIRGRKLFEVLANNKKSHLEEKGQECSAESDWPWNQHAPLLAMCSRQSSNATWRVQKVVRPPQYSSFVQQICEPSSACSSHQFIDARAYKLKAKEQVFGQDARHDWGAMHDLVLRIQSTDGKWYIMKDTSSNRETGIHAAKTAYSIRKMVDDCGFAGLVARPFLGHILASVYSEDNSYLQQVSLRNAHFSIFQDGVSVASIESIASKDPSVRTKALAVLKNIAEEDVLLVTAFDFLTAQMDRVSKNVMMDHAENIHLIDNLDSSFGNYLGGRKLQDIIPKNNMFLHPASPYFVECFVRNLSNGQSMYPPQLLQCLTHIEQQETDQIYSEYKLLSLAEARLVKRRASLLLQGVDTASEVYLGSGYLGRLKCLQHHSAAVV
mmetsp:Transcript_3845/g.24359  ORF Transcript_3845/g.24359 Transcript_3845/m.24359 type:complete len:394 (+) Transcript_3845:276-1457(+)